MMTEIEWKKLPNMSRTLAPNWKNFTIHTQYDGIIDSDDDIYFYTPIGEIIPEDATHWHQIDRVFGVYRLTPELKTILAIDIMAARTYVKYKKPIGHIIYSQWMATL